MATPASQPRFPTWVTDLGAMLEGKARIRAICTVCSEWRQVDLAALIASKGRRYSLINRRCRCRLTPGCLGWDRFYYLSGVYRPLWTRETAARWSR